MNWHELKIPFAQSFVAAILLAVIVIGWQMLRVRTADQAIDHSTFQVITLTNGRTYFGSLEDLGKDYVVLKNAFFLQSTVASEDSAQAADTTSEDEAPVALQRMSSLMYRPQNDFYVRANEVISWQNLDKDSRVAEAIQEYFKTQEEDDEDK